MNTGQTERPDPWAELKHAIRVYLTLTQGPSEALCARLLKLPDFLDDQREGRDSSEEMIGLAYALVREIGDGTMQRAEQFRNRPGLADAARRLRCCLEWADGVHKLDAKRGILHDVELTLRALQETTGDRYPSVPV